MTRGERGPTPNQILLIDSKPQTILPSNSWSKTSITVGKIELRTTWGKIKERGILLNGDGENAYLRSRQKVYPAGRSWEILTDGMEERKLQSQREIMASNHSGGKKHPEKLVCMYRSQIVDLSGCIIDQKALYCYGRRGGGLSQRIR